jgi:hypothetical protein
MRENQDFSQMHCPGGTHTHSPPVMTYATECEGNEQTLLASAKYCSINTHIHTHHTHHKHTHTHKHTPHHIHTTHTYTPLNVFVQLANKRGFTKRTPHTHTHTHTAECICTACKYKGIHKKNTPPTHTQTHTKRAPRDDLCH